MSAALLRRSLSALPALLRCGKAPAAVSQCGRRSFIYRTLDDVRKADMVKNPSEVAESRRYMLRRDGLGFSMHETVLYKGQRFFMHYANHLEAVFITKGTGWVEVVQHKDDLGNGKRYPLSPGVCYALDAHDKHWLHADDGGDLHVVCCFAPPCDGDETLSEDGRWRIFAGAGGRSIVSCVVAGVFPYIGEDGAHQYDYWERMERDGKPITVTLGKSPSADGDGGDVDVSSSLLDALT